MKHIVRIVIFFALLCLYAKAAPFVAVGDNAELFVTAAATVQFDDNIYLDPSNEKNDTIFSFTPGVDLVFGKGSSTSGDFYYREEFRRYNSNDNQNTELSNVGVTSTYSNGVTKADFNASYAQVAQNDNDINLVGAIVRRKLTNVGARSEFGISEKTKLSLGLTYNKTDYGPSNYTDSDIWAVPVDVYYESSPKLDWSLGYQYRQTGLSGTGIDSNDNFFNLGARGEFTPKLTGQVRLGYTQRSFDAGRDESLFGVSSNLTYTYSDKTSYQVSVGNDFGSSSTGTSTKNFSLGLNASTHFTEQWYLNAGINFRSIDYSNGPGNPGRTDDYTEGQISLAYVYNTNVTFSASLTLRNNSSDLAAAEFTNNVFSLGANIRY